MLAPYWQKTYNNILITWLLLIPYFHSLIIYFLLWIVFVYPTLAKQQIQTLWYMTDQMERESRDFDLLFLIFIQRSVAQFVFSTLFSANWWPGIIITRLSRRFPFLMFFWYQLAVLFIPRSQRFISTYLDKLGSLFQFDPRGTLPVFLFSCYFLFLPSLSLSLLLSTHSVIFLVNECRR